MSVAVDLHYTVQGEGNPLLILHGLYGAGNNWGRHAAWLSEHYRVILPDLRNHGRSPHAPDMSYPAMAEDLRQLLDREEVERALVLGHSMGGKAAMTLALTLPDRVRALVVADVAPVSYSGGHGHRELIQAMRDVPLAELSDRRSIDQALAAEIPETMVRQFLLTNLQGRTGAYSWRIPLDILADQLPQIMDFPAVGNTYPEPTLFLHGTESDYLISNYEDSIRALFPQARIASIAGAGHWLHVEQPDAFAERLGEFLREHR